MFGSEVLDVAIGILFVYLTLSLICSAIQEGIAAFFKLRAKDLYLGIRNLLNDPKGSGLAQDFYNHPLITRFFPARINREITTISPRIFRPKLLRWRSWTWPRRRLRRRPLLLEEMPRPVRNPCETR